MIIKEEKNSGQKFKNCFKSDDWSEIAIPVKYLFIKKAIGKLKQAMKNVIPIKIFLIFNDFNFSKKQTKRTKKVIGIPARGWIKRTAIFKMIKKTKGKALIEKRR